MSVFRFYKEAYLAMETDTDVMALRSALETVRNRHNVEIEELEAVLETKEAPYRKSMDAAENGIVAIVMEEKETKTLHGVRASYYSARASTSWKKVAEAMDPPTALIQENTSYSDPRVKVEIKE